MQDSSALNDKATINKPELPFWQVWNLSFGFLGVQFGFALQNANVSRILSDLGADLHSLSFFWILAPLMGLIVQPWVGSASDKTWNRLGRRRPFILGGAIVASIAMFLMPNAPLFVTFMLPMIFGVVMLAIMDASFNVCFQPFRALVSDMLPDKQRTVGYSIQTVLINIGAIFGSILPFLLTNVVGLENAAEAGQVAPSVTWAFYIGASVLLGSVLWTVFKTKEYPPEKFKQFQNDASEAQSTNTNSSIWFLLKTMPDTMKQLALVQFFSWFALFAMWVYTTPAVTQSIWGVEAQWFDSNYLSSLESVPESIRQAKGSAGDWVGILFAGYSLFAALFAVIMTKLSSVFSRKKIYMVGLLAGAAGYIGIGLIGPSEMTSVNLLFTQVDIPQNALWLLLPMVGVGMAWAVILALPYAILAGSLPVSKTGAYMGIFNFTIAIPQIISGLTVGWLLKYVFNNQAMSIIILAGVCMLIAAFCVLLVKDTRSAT